MSVFSSFAMSKLGQIVFNGHLIYMTSPSFFAGNGTLKPE
jgi:hypothetical protein